MPLWAKCLRGACRPCGRYLVIRRRIFPPCGRLSVRRAHHGRTDGFQPGVARRFFEERHQSASWEERLLSKDMWASNLSASPGVLPALSAARAVLKASSLVGWCASSSRSGCRHGVSSPWQGLTGVVGCSRSRQCLLGVRAVRASTRSLPSLLGLGRATRD